MSYAQIEITDSGLAIIWLDQEGERVNTLTGEMLDEFNEHVSRIEGDSGIAGAVLASRKKDFIVGADVNQILEIESPGQAEALSRAGQKFLSRIATAAKPTVAAIHGACMGGGLEVALACPARIASDSPRTVMALPEVQLGLLPGAGGTQRLPRLVGLTKSLDMMLTGKRLYAKQALRAGLVDALVSEGGLVDGAQKIALEIVAGTWTRKPRRQSKVQWFLDETPIGRKLVYRGAEKKVLKQTLGNYPAPIKILEAVSTGLEAGIEAGYDTESKGFDFLATTDVAKNLIGIFQAMTERKKNPMADQARPVKRIGILGAGLMGAGIANVSLRQEYDCVLKDIDWERVSAGQKHVYQDLNRRFKRGAIRRTERDRFLSRVAGTTDWKMFDSVDVVIEAVFEDLNLKRQIVKETEAATGPETIFASNTSALPITQIAAASSRPETVIGMHYFSPVEKMPLLEIITTDQTADWVTATAVEIGIRQGKTPIVVGDGPGFYTSRILAPFMNEAMLLLEEGCEIKFLDQALKRFGFPVGPITLLDEVGLDVAAHVGQNMSQAFQESGREGKTSRLAEEMIERGFKGRKNKRGFFLYGRKKKVNRAAYSVIQAEKRRAFSRDTVAERLTLQMVNEAAYCLGEGILQSAADGDIGAILGLGFPPFRGGPFHYIDTLGASHVVNRMEALRQEHGPRFTPARSWSSTPILIESFVRVVVG